MASGVATMAAMQKDPSIGALLANPFALTPGFTGAPQPDGDTAYEDTVTGSWVTSFMMAGINTKAVHRTNFLLGHPWGEDFRYDEMLMIPGKPDAASPGSAGFDFGAAARSRRRPVQGRARGGLLRHPLHRRDGRRPHPPRLGEGRHGPGLRLDVEDAGGGRPGPGARCRSHGHAGRMLDAGLRHGRRAAEAPAREGGRSPSRSRTDAPAPLGGRSRQGCSGYSSLLVS